MDEQGGVSEQAQRRGETEEQRLDRNLDELLQELRIVMPGIQFLFAFLLVVPFQQGWVEVTSFEKAVYYVTLLTTTAASVCLLSAPARHRIRFRDLDKRWVVEGANRLALAGMALLAVSITGAILLISHVVYSGLEAAIASVLVASSIFVVWFLIPLMRELRERSD
jgi:Family of unknown function (DUF6328)